MTHLKSEDKLEGETASEDESDEKMDSEVANEDEPESKEEVMNDNCLGRRRRGWSGGNMSSSGASSAAHAQGLTALACFLLGVCASNYAGRLRCWMAVMAVPLRCQFTGIPFSGNLYVTSHPLTETGDHFLS